MTTRRDRTLADFTVGQRVSVRPNGQKATEGTVTKIGRKYLTITYGAREEQFTPDGKIHNDYGHCWFLTDEDIADGERRAKVERVLRAHKLQHAPNADEAVMERVARFLDPAEFAPPYKEFLAAAFGSELSERKISAVKAVRSEYNLGLKEARDVVWGVLGLPY